MKRIALITITILAIAAIFSSCKKEEQSIENPSLELKNNTLSQHAVFPGFEQIYFDLMLAPEDVTDGKVTIKVKTNADTEGFSLDVNTSKGEYTEGKIKYQYERATGIIFAANHTDEAGKKIKVNPTGDEVVITAGDNIIEKKIPFTATETLKYTFWNASASATLFIYGYSYNGNENLKIEAWSTRDNQTVDINGKWDDPSIYQGLRAFDNYSFDIKFNDGFSYPADTLVGIYPEGDTVFVKFKNKTYWGVYNASSSGMMNEL